MAKLGAIRPVAPEFVRVDLSNCRRVLTVGDIHGYFGLLEQKLEEIAFDPELDRLILLGDLIDRGEDSDQALEWCSKPGILRIRGNHEDLLIKTVADHESDDRFIHLQHGGAWFDDIEDEAERQRWADTLLDAPVAIEALTPGGRRVGFVHADVPAPTWLDLVADLAEPDDYARAVAAYDCMWSRARFDDLRRHMVYGAIEHFQCEIPGIDHVFFGHSITREPITHDNCSWIDTGVYKHGVLTMVDVDQWIASPGTMKDAA